MMTNDRGMRLMVMSVLWIAPVGAAAQDSAVVAEPDTATRVTIQPTDAAEPADESRPSAALGVVWTNHYFFRGIVQETRGAIFQPSLESGFPLYEGDGALSSVALSLGVWSSLHTEHPANESAPAGWYEADFYAGLAFGLAETVSLGVTYTAYTSPNGSFATVHELAGSLSWDDAGLWESAAGGRFGGVQPSVTVARELDGTAFGPDEGTYLEAGIEPGVAIVPEGEVSLAVSLPVALGASLGDYYEDEAGDDAFGYVNAGVSLTAGLGFVPQRYGSWELSLGGSVLLLGDHLETANDGRATELLVQGGLTVGY